MVKIFRFSTVLLLTNLLILQVTLGAPLPQEELVFLEKDLRARADFISLMLKVGEEIDKDPKVDSSILNRPTQMTVLLQEKMKIYQQYYAEALQIPAEKRGIFKKTLMSLNWSNIVPLLKKSHIGIETFFKKKGIGVGIAILLGFLCEYLVPMTLIQLGLASLIPISMLTPYQVMYSFVPGYLHKLKIKKMLTESLGGKVQVEAYLKQQEYLLKELHMQSPQDLIYPMSESDGMVKSIVVPKLSWEQRVLQYLGVTDGVFDYNSIQKFLINYSVSDPYITWVMENNKFTKEMKTAIISGHLLNLNDENITTRFYENFSDNIITLKAHNNWEEVWDWTQEMKKITKLEDLYQKIDETPTSIHPKEVASIWENFLLPEYVKNFDLSYLEARKMFDEFEVVKAKLTLANTAEFDDKTKNEVYTYLKKIVAKKTFSGCKNSPAKINQFLLQKAL